MNYVTERQRRVSFLAWVFPHGLTYLYTARGYTMVRHSSHRRRTSPHRRPV